MICPDCRGRGWTPRMAAIDDAADDLGPMMGPCETCGGGGWASSSDAAGIGRSDGLCAQRFVCAACGALQTHRMIICEDCGEPLVFLVGDAA